MVCEIQTEGERHGGNRGKLLIVAARVCSSTGVQPPAKERKPLFI